MTVITDTPSACTLHIMITDRQKWHVSVGSRVLGERCHQPAGAAEVLEAVLIAPELRARCHAAHLAEGVGKVRVNLDLCREIRRLDLNESSSDGAAVGLHVVEGGLAGPNGVHVLVHINACIHDPAEEADEC